MSDNAILLKPFEKKNQTVYGTDDVRSCVFLAGNLWSPVFLAGGSQKLYKVPILNTAVTTFNSGISAINVKDICTDGTNLYIAEENTTSSRLISITTGGVGTSLGTIGKSVRSIRYDSENLCIYAACPADGLILKFTGGGIGGNSDSFVSTTFYSGITNNPGRLWLSKDFSTLYFTTESNVKQIGALPIINGSPGTPNYYNIMMKLVESTCLIYFDEFDTFLIADGDANSAKTGELVSLSLYSFVMSAHSITTRMGQADKTDENDYAFPDTNGTAGVVRYGNLTS